MSPGPPWIWAPGPRTPLAAGCCRGPRVPVRQAGSEPRASLTAERRFRRAPGAAVQPLLVGSVATIDAGQDSGDTGCHSDTKYNRFGPEKGGGGPVAPGPSKQTRVTQPA